LQNIQTIFSSKSLIRHEIKTIEGRRAFARLTYALLGIDGMLGETGFEEKYGLNISATYCFTITYIVIKKESHLPVTLPP